MGATSASHRRRVGAAITVLAWLSVAPAAHADPPAPTDYRSEVVGIEPAVDTVEATIVGGDSFLQLRVATGSTATVPGYQGEPFLEFAADGTVRENRASPTWFLNESRYGADVPADIGIATPPRWVQVASDGTYAWHDHRTHWMSPDPPSDASRGEQILRGVIPVVVDGVDVEITVVSTWEPRPSPWPAIFGLLAGTALAVAAITRRRHGELVAATAALAAAALAIGTVQFRSVPPETGPSPMLWLLPLVALLIAIATARLRQRVGWLVTAAMVTIAAVQLALWGWVRRAVLVRAVLPTDAPWWLDRFVTACVLVGAPALAVAAIWPVVAALRHRDVPVTA